MRPGCQSFLKRASPHFASPRRWTDAATFGIRASCDAYQPCWHGVGLPRPTRCFPGGLRTRPIDPIALD